MDDTISRQDAIMAVKTGALSAATIYGRTDEGSTALYETVRAIKALPSAQPEIIHCGECKYKDDGIDEDGIPFLKCLNGRSYGGTRINDYCSWAERRQDE